MYINEIQNILEKTVKVRSRLHFDRYIQLISYYLVNHQTVKDSLPGTFEKHHILPRKIFPQYMCSKWNIVILPAKAHYLAHYLLFKACSDKSFVYAFNQMRRISKSNGVSNCRLYASVKKEFAEIISQNNSSRAMSDENKSRMRLLYKGTNVYRNKKTKELRRFLVGQQPDDWEPFQKGRKRSSESKQKIKEKMNNRIWQYNPSTKEVKFAKSLVDGFVEGYPDWYENGEYGLQDYIWVHNPISGINLRIHNSKNIPEGFIEGRKFENKGFQKINNSDLMRVVNLESKTFMMINKIDFDPYLHLKTGTSIENIFLYQYNGTVYLYYNDMISNCSELIEMKKRNDSINQMVVPKPHPNMTEARRNFCKLHSGKTMNQIGLTVIKLKDFIYNRRMIHVRCNSN